MRADGLHRRLSGNMGYKPMAYKRTAKSADKLAGKAWKIQGESSDGKVVTLGRYDTEESAKSDQTRILEDGFYRKLKIVYTPPPPGQNPVVPGKEAEAELKEPAEADIPIDEDLVEAPESDTDVSE